MPPGWCLNASSISSQSSPVVGNNQLWLPKGCSVDPLAQLLSRAYNPRPLSSWEAPKLGFGAALELCQLTWMLFADEALAGILKALCRAVLTEEDIREVVAFCNEFEVPEQLQQVATELEQRGCAAKVGSDQVKELLHNAIHESKETARKVAFRFLDRLLARRVSQGGAAIATKDVEMLHQMIQLWGDPGGFLRATGLSTSSPLPGSFEFAALTANFAMVRAPRHFLWIATGLLKEEKTIPCPDFLLSPTMPSLWKNVALLRTRM